MINLKKYLIIGGMPNTNRDNVTCVSLLKPTKSAIGLALVSRLYQRSKSRRYINPKIFEQDPDVVIVFDSGITKNFLYQIKKQFSGKRLIFFYFNPVELTFDIKEVPSDFEIWSYSEYDSNKYKIKKNGQILNDYLYKECLAVSNMNISTINDLVFVGTDKGRRTFLEKYKKELSSIGVDVNLVITKKRAFTIPTKRHRKKMTYREYLIEEAKASAIIDYCVNENAGITLRPLEAIILKKKIVTNCNELLKSKMMESGNIISISEEPSKIKDFVSKPYNPVPLGTIKEYLFDSWIKNFD